MEKDIETRLKEIYNLDLDVKILKFGLYEVFMTIDKMTLSVIFLYDSHYNFQANLTNIIQKIDNSIVGLYKRKG